MCLVFFYFCFICSISFTILWIAERNYSWFLFQCLSLEQKNISRVLAGKFNSHSVLILKTALRKSSLTDLSTFIQDQRITSICLNLNASPNILQHCCSTSHFPGSSHYMQHLTPEGFEAQEKEPEGHWQNKNLLPQLSSVKGQSPLLETLRILVCYLSNGFLQSCLGRAREVKISCSTYIYSTTVVGLWVQLETLNASTTQV